MFHIVIIGAGAIARAAHVPAAIASPWIELVGIVDPDTARARKLAADYGLKTSIAATIDGLSQSFDAAIVATPNDHHAETAIALLDRDIPALVEKPLATSVADAQAVADAASRQNKVCAVGYHTRHSGACRALKQAVDSIRFGEVTGFAHQDGSRGGWSPVSGYNLDVNRAGGGVLVSTGTHMLERLLWLWGWPDSYAFRDNADGGPESHCIVEFDYTASRGFSGSAFFSKVVNLAENTVVETTDGVLIMASDAGDSIVFRPHDEPSLEFSVCERGAQIDPRGLYQRQLEDFAQACLDNGRPCVDATIGVESVRLVRGLYDARQSIEPACAPAA